MVHDAPNAQANSPQPVTSADVAGVTVAELLIASADLAWSEGLQRLVHADPAATRRAVVRNLAVAPPGARSAVWAALACGR